MHWDVEFHDAFEPEFEALPEEVQDELLAQATLLAQFGPLLGRPRVDTLKNSDFANMKELRFDSSGGVWRVAFAFDRGRTAILLACGNKSGVGESEFYRRLIRKADARFAAHLRAVQRR
jgi:hypothetical protein